MSENELEMYRKVLNELAELANHASLTGAISDGRERAVKRYNTILDKLVEFDVFPDGLYEALPLNATFGDLAVESRMLAAQLAPKKKKDKGDPGILMRLAPFVGAEELGELVREQIRHSKDFDMDLVANLAPFLGQGMLGDLVRMNLQKAAEAEAENAVPPTPPTPPTPPSAPVPPSAPAPVVPPVPPVPHEETYVPSQSTPVTTPEASQKPEELLALLKNPHLSESERAALVTRLEAAVSVPF